MFAFKKTVVSDGAAPQTWFAMGVFYALHSLLAGGRFVVTAVRDGKHEPGSKHYTGEAFDMRVWYITPEQRARIVEKARELLDPLGYDIISAETPGHQDHDHCEFDPKEGEIWVSSVN